MRMHELRDTLRKAPFEPFRIRLSDGRSFDVRHPEFAGLTRHSFFVGEPAADEEGPERLVQCDLMHVVSIEPINGRTAKRKPKRK